MRRLLGGGFWPCWPQWLSCWRAVHRSLTLRAHHLRPSPSPPVSTSPTGTTAAPSMGADFALNGSLVTDDRQIAEVHSELWLGRSSTPSDFRSPRPGGRIDLRVPVRRNGRHHEHRGPSQRGCSQGLHLVSCRQTRHHSPSRNRPCRAASQKPSRVPLYHAHLTNQGPISVSCRRRPRVPVASRDRTRSARSARPAGRRRIRPAA